MIATVIEPTAAKPTYFLAVTIAALAERSVVITMVLHTAEAALAK